MSGLVTVKLLEVFRATPLTRMVTGPVVAAAGTVARMLPPVSLEMSAGTPLKATVALPCASSRPEPVMVTGVPLGPLLGETPVRAGKG